MKLTTASGTLTPSELQLQEAARYQERYLHLIESLKTPAGNVTVSIAASLQRYRVRMEGYQQMMRTIVRPIPVVGRRTE